MDPLRIASSLLPWCVCPSLAIRPGSLGRPARVGPTLVSGAACDLSAVVRVRVSVRVRVRVGIGVKVRVRG